MKLLEELYAEIQNDESLKREFVSSFKEGDVENFLKVHECNATAEDVMKYMNSLREGAVSDDDLDQVAGGCFTGFTNAYTCGCG